jgi:monofunctional biosynthetic peptidoglycan transglycosylase
MLRGLKRRPKQILLWGGTGFLFLALALTILAVRDASRLAHHYPVVAYKGKGTPPEVTLQTKRPASWVQLSQVSKPAVGAILVSEDWAFYHHKGLDPAQIREALRVNFEKGGYVRGASTITQQVVKNVFLSSRKSLWRKLMEVVWARSLERVVSKRRILEVYLNVAEWGEGIYGIGPASWTYFQQSPSSLDAKQGAFLAMLLPNPRKYSASFRQKQLTPYARRTVDRILGKMAQAGYLGVEEARALSYEPLAFEMRMEEEWTEEPSEESLTLN